MHPKTEKAIAEMRAKCKNEADHKFVDSFESACKLFEAPREPIDPFKNIHLSSKAWEAWDDAIKEALKAQGYNPPTYKIFGNGNNE